MNFSYWIALYSSVNVNTGLSLNSSLPNERKRMVKMCVKMARKKSFWKILFHFSFLSYLNSLMIAEIWNRVTYLKTADRTHTFERNDPSLLFCISLKPFSLYWDKFLSVSHNTHFPEVSGFLSIRRFWVWQLSHDSSPNTFLFYLYNASLMSFTLCPPLSLLFLLLPFLSPSVFCFSYHIQYVKLCDCK